MKPLARTQWKKHPGFPPYRVDSRVGDINKGSCDGGQKEKSIMQLGKTEWPWEREANYNSTFPDSNPISVNYRCTKFRPRCYENLHLDIYTKMAAIKASASVVSLVTYSDDREIFQGTGTILDKDGTILTSTKLVTCPLSKNTVAKRLKVIVHLVGGKSYEAKLLAYNFYYGIAVVKIEPCGTQLKPACLRVVDDCVSLDLPVCDDNKDFQPPRHSNAYNLVPGDKVIALGRYFLNPYWLMAAPGEFSMNQVSESFECKELFRATCLIAETGTGGPLVNCHGEVIGVARYYCDSTPFIPINIALKWWKLHKNYENLHQPHLLGLEVANLYTSDLLTMEKVIHKFPNQFAGVIVEEVKQGSCADKAGIRPNDLIVECCGKPVRSFLEWFDLILDNTENSVKLGVIRGRSDARLNLTMEVVNATKSKKRKRRKKNKKLTGS